MTTDNFPHLREATKGESNHSKIQGGQCSTTGGVDDGDSKQENSNDIETGVTPPMTASNTREPSTRSSVSNSMEAMEEDQLGVEIPTPGFQFAAKATVAGHLKKRQVPNLCRYVDWLGTPFVIPPSSFSLSLPYTRLSFVHCIRYFVVFVSAITILERQLFGVATKVANTPFMNSAYSSGS